MRRALPTPKSRILIVDDHPMMREGLMSLISQQPELVCCGETATASDTLRAVARTNPHLIILDLRLKGSDGLELIKVLKTQYPSLVVLVLSQYDAPMYA